MFSQLTRDSYDASAQEYAAKTFSVRRQEELLKFARSLPQSATVLDLGCGPGFDARDLSEMGFRVIAVDAANSMIEIAKKNAPEAEFHVADICRLDFSQISCDGIWANHSLHHIAKDTLPSVFSHLFQLLKPDGIFYVSVKQGTNEGIEKDARYGGIEKFWSYFQVDELRCLLASAGFEISEIGVHPSTHDYHTHPSIIAFARKASIFQD